MVTPGKAGQGQAQQVSASEPSSQQRSVSGEPRCLPVAGIGASAGGLEALEEFFQNATVDAQVAYVVVTHQQPGHASLLPELLAHQTQMPVVQATQGVQLQPNHIYVNPPGAQVEIRHGVLHLQVPSEADRRLLQLPIDHFFRSLAEDQKERAICIILSGTGTDGTLGLKAVKGESGMAMVQQPQSAKYAGMPSSAIATGLVDYVLPAAELPRQLANYVRGAYWLARPASSHETLPEEPLQNIFMLLRTRTGHDFSAYKDTTIRRRIQRRMNVHQIEDPAQYARYLRENEHEIDNLFRELLISVTSFFRDDKAFDALAAGPLQQLLEVRADNDTLRVWVPGCATGEEVYSLAILLHECMQRVEKHFELQIFGTDLDSEAIETARVGVYPSGIEVDVQPDRLERYFMREESHYRIRKEIREMAVFAQQNVIKDPPFTRLDLLSCRNLLIYLKSDLQKRLLPIFHYALRPDGLLFLGPSESVSHYGDLFEVVDKKWKIFRRSPTAKYPGAFPPLPQVVGVKETAGGTRPPANAGKQATLPALIERMLLQRYCPACVVVSTRGDIVYVHGRTGEYLELADGQARTNVFDMARKGLPHELAALMRQAGKGDAEVWRRNISVKTNGGYTQVDLCIARILEPEPIRGLLLISFHAAAPSGSVAEDVRELHPDVEMASTVALEQELEFARESHRATLEELETSNEELKSTNEELQSTNEELQSSNEELETSKEEMQSLNEELTTVNAELQSKLEDLSRSNNDMQNLLNSTDIATVFLDAQLNIQRFTDKARGLVMLRETDIGRPIHELASDLKYEQLAEDCQVVLNTLVRKEIEVQTRKGRWYLLRILPYRTSENIVEGLVLTFVDVHQLKQGRDATAFFASIVNTIREPLVILDEQLQIVAGNKSFYRTFESNPDQTLGRQLYELGSVKWDVRELRRLLEQVLPQKTTIEDFEVAAQFPKDGTRRFSFNARRLIRDVGEAAMIFLAIKELTGHE